MKEVIYCKTTAKGVHSFYLSTGSEVFYLFRQDSRRGVGNYFRKGVYLKDALDFSKAHNDVAIIRTMKKIPMHIKYLEKEYGIEILERTKRRNDRLYGRRRCAQEKIMKKTAFYLENAADLQEEGR